MSDTTTTTTFADDTAVLADSTDQCAANSECKNSTTFKSDQQKDEGLKDQAK